MSEKIETKIFIVVCTAVLLSCIFTIIFPFPPVYASICLSNHCSVLVSTIVMAVF